MRRPRATPRSPRSSLVAALLAWGGVACGPGSALSDAGTSDAALEAATPACLEPAEPGGHGAPCRCATDCRAGALCYEEALEGAPRGRCTVLDACADDEACGADARCRDGRCVMPCEQASDCRAGYACTGASCLPQCQADDDCDSGRCDRYSGNCVPLGAAVRGLENHEPCTNNDQCRSRYCDATRRECLSFCSGVRQGCPQGDVCVTNSSTVDLGVCRARCSPGESCPEGLTCRTVPRAPTGTYACR